MCNGVEKPLGPLLAVLILVFAALIVVRSPNRPTDLPETCLEYLDCPPRFYCIEAKYTQSDMNKCMCNVFLLHYGDNCDKTSHIVPILYGIAFIWSIQICFSSALVVLNKAKNKKLKMNASTTTLVLISLSSSCFALMCITNVCRTLKIGNAAILESPVYPLGNSFSGMFAILATLNVPMLWIELANQKKLTSLNNLGTTKYFVAGFAFFYVLVTVLTYLIFNTLEYFFMLTAVYCLLIAVIYLVGASLLSKKMMSHTPTTQTNQTAGGSRSARITGSAKKISLHLVLMIVSVVVATATMKIPSTKPIPLVCNLLGISTMLSMFSSLQTYLGARKTKGSHFWCFRSWRVKMKRFFCKYNRRGWQLTFVNSKAGSNSKYTLKTKS